MDFSAAEYLVSLYAEICNMVWCFKVLNETRLQLQSFVISVVSCYVVYLSSDLSECRP